KNFACLHISLTWRLDEGAGCGKNWKFLPHPAPSSNLQVREICYTWIYSSIPFGMKEEDHSG
ncbi:MAG TPA: hypothetical protein VF458_21815, partial [Ktedonobacteraceae bacterium]